MKDSLLAKYTAARPGEADNGAERPAEGLEDLGAFGLLRGLHERSIMLEVHCKDGTVHAFGYAWLSRAKFDPSEGITLHFGTNTVKITGRNLDAEVRTNVKLFAAIARHRVPWIREADEPAVLSLPKHAVVVESVEIG